VEVTSGLKGSWPCFEPSLDPEHDSVSLLPSV